MPKKKNKKKKCEKVIILEREIFATLTSMYKVLFQCSCQNSLVMYDLVVKLDDVLVKLLKECAEGRKAFLEFDEDEE